MGVSVVKLANGETLVDMSDATITEETVLEGYTGYGANGELIVGRAASVKKTEVNITLPKSGWVDNQQTIAVSCVASGSTVFAGGDSGSEPEYSTCEVHCSAQADGELTFSCTYLPMEDVVANVVVFTSPAKILYKLPKETVFDGSAGQAIDTGVMLFDAAKDFTIVVDATGSDNSARRLLDATDYWGSNGNLGGVRINTNFSWNNAGFTVSGCPTNDGADIFTCLSTTERTKMAVVYKQGIPHKWYHRTASANDVTAKNPNSYGVFEYTQHTKTARIGGGGNSAYIGTIHALEIYDAVLTVDEITEKLKF